MTYKIIRNEHRVRNGVDEIFLNIEIETEDDAFQKAMWLHEDDVALVLANSSHIKVIAESLETKGKKERKNKLKDKDKSHEMEIARLNNETAHKNLDTEQIKSIK